MTNKSRSKPHKTTTTQSIFQTIAVMGLIILFLALGEELGVLDPEPAPTNHPTCSLY